MKNSPEQHIKPLVDSGRTDEAMAMLNTTLEQNPDDDCALFLRGKLNWKLGNRTAAMNDYTAAAHINPESPAATALEQLNDIQNFFNTDLMNP